jgi:D-serine dehydratase
MTRMDRDALKNLEKSLPADFHGDSSEIAGKGWSLARDVPLPNIVLNQDILIANIQLFQRYINEHNALLAPHAKATMCPEIWREQLAAGAWGLTVATVSQLEVCIAFGVKRILIANEVIDTYSARRLAKILAQDERVEIICLVDSEEGIRRLSTAISESDSTRRLDILVEFGMKGGRAGVRSIEDLLSLANSVTNHAQTLRLVGVEGYEGILGASRDPELLAVVDEYLQSWVAAIRAVLPLIEPSAPRLASAGGSIFFDRVISAFATLGSDCKLVIRGGCYVTHDSGLFDKASPFGTFAPGEHPHLEPAIRVYAAVLSRPEKGLAIVGAGVRDIPVAEGLPVVHAVHAADGSVRDGGALHPRKANDQHLYVDVPDEDPLAVGDVLELGISHPCAVFDRWRTLLVSNGDGQIVGTALTYF